MPETGKQSAFDLESSFGEALSLKVCAIRRRNDVVSCYVIVLQASRARVRDQVDSRPQSRLAFLATRD